ncbi:MAG: YceI family protein [Steroidobacteraceae bacterium]
MTTGRRRSVVVAAAAFAAGWLAGGPAWGATAWSVDPGASRIGFTATLAGGEFDGRFGDFTADIAFDPADAREQSFRVVIRTGSAATGDASRDEALVGPDFFSTTRWPDATYVADRFSAAGPGRWVAHGRLTLRGVSRDEDVEFTFKPGPGDTAVLAGGTTVRRLDFGVGQGDWRDTSVLGNDVRISFSLLLHRK